MFKIDMHVHTSEVSACGKIQAVEAVNLYKQAGYQGIVITDHYTEDYFESISAIDWNGKVDRYLMGYQYAKEQGQKIGLTVLLGMEIRFQENPSDYLVYGITEEFLRNYPKLYELGIETFYRKFKNKDILIFQAHPYRKGMIIAKPEYLHGIEVFNGNARHESYNEKAYQFAQKHGLLMSSGSDFHEMEDLARGGMIFIEDITSSAELVKAYKDNLEKELLNIAL